MPVLTGELGGRASSEPLVTWRPIRRPGFRASPTPPLPLSGSRRRVAILRRRSVGCRLGWLVVVVRKLVMPRHSVCICKGRHMLQ